MKLCTVCGALTSRAGSRCTDHARQSNRGRHNALYSTRSWQRLSARVLRAWRGEHGDWCPGYQRATHQASDLTVDHVVPLAAGGAPFAIDNTAVLCRSCNSTKGASMDGGGVAHGTTRVRPDRDFALVAQSPTDYYELYLYNAISKTDSAELTFGDESMAAIKVSLGSRRDGANLALPSWRLRIPA